jgi:twitching motility protein PilT
MGNGKTVMYQLLTETVDRKASDLHLTVDSRPCIRLSGELTRLDYPVLSQDEARELIFSMMTERQKQRFGEELEIDFGCGIEGRARFRASVFLQRGCVSAVFRVIPLRISTLEELGLPEVLVELTRRRRGLVLVAGPTGCGKSTTLASMIDRINSQRRGHIVTIEDPIEFLHSHKGCLVSQRELNSDVKSFAQALRTILREDPDVVLIGEMRDLETVNSALRIAETGHLTLATLHTNTAQSTINRIISFFPSHQQEQVRRQVSLALEGIVCQRLLPQLGRGGTVVATEILIPTLGIRNLIRDKRDHQIYSAMQAGQDRSGMHTMNQSLVELLRMKKIDYRVALAESPDRAELLQILQLRGLGGVGRNGWKGSGKPLSERGSIGCLSTNSREETTKPDHW